MIDEGGEVVDGVSSDANSEPKVNEGLAGVDTSDSDYSNAHIDASKLGEVGATSQTGGG